VAEEVCGAVGVDVAVLAGVAVDELVGGGLEVCVGV
jgi:hypothetical protein